MARFAVVAAADQSLLASVAIKPLPEAGGEIGYMAATGARGRGFTAAALRLLAGWAFAALRMERLEALIQPANEASIRTAERPAFPPMGPAASAAPSRASGTPTWSTCFRARAPSR